MFYFYARASRWLCEPHAARRLVLFAFLCTLPSLAMGLHADDYILREQVSLEIQRVDDRSLELHAPRSWFATPFDRIGAPFRRGARIALASLTVELREVDAAGAPMRARFTFDRSLDDPGLTFGTGKEGNSGAGRRRRPVAACSFRRRRRFERETFRGRSTWRHACQVHKLRDLATLPRSLCRTSARYS